MWDNGYIYIYILCVCDILSDILSGRFSGMSSGPCPAASSSLATFGSAEKVDEERGGEESRDPHLAGGETFFNKSI